MSPLRQLFLWAQHNEFLRTRLPRSRAVQRAVSRFMPGEELEDALRAADRLWEADVASVLTRLGEHVHSPEAAEAVASHYLRVLERGSEREADIEVSVKLSHLGLELDADFTREKVAELVEAAADRDAFVWIDMEESDLTDVTLEIYRALLANRRNVGLCLQAYLYRTAEDLEELLNRGGSIRLVKGAYDEPPEVAFPKKADVDENFLQLARRLLEDLADGDGVSRHAFGTHDLTLIGKIRGEAAGMDVPRDLYEIQMLYGIREGAQKRLAREGASVRSLISYGREWFPWYMRRLAERPANVWFVIRNMFA